MFLIFKQLLLNIASIKLFPDYLIRLALIKKGEVK